MAKWYDQYLTEQERKNLQVGQKGIRARNRKQEEAENRGYPRSSIPVSQPSKANAEAGITARKTREQNVKTAQQNTLAREKQSGAAYAQKMQGDAARRKAIQDAFRKKR